jgi:cytochrome c2
MIRTKQFPQGLKIQDGSVDGEPMKVRNATGGALGVALATLVWLLNPLGGPARAQSSSSQASSDKPAQKDEYQRSTEIFLYRTTAKSGPQRGEELYYYKCWMCHNQFAKTGPQLHDLFKRPTFSSSADEVNEKTVTAKIKEGGPGMPSFGTTLKDADIVDLIAYIKDGCCFDSENPPPNPRYKGKK